MSKVPENDLEMEYLYSLATGKRRAPVARAVPVRANPEVNRQIRESARVRALLTEQVRSGVVTATRTRPKSTASISHVSGHKRPTLPARPHTSVIRSWLAHKSLLFFGIGSVAAAAGLGATMIPRNGNQIKAITEDQLNLTNEQLPAPQFRSIPEVQVPAVIHSTHRESPVQEIPHSEKGGARTDHRGAGNNALSPDAVVADSDSTVNHTVATDSHETVAYAQQSPRRVIMRRTDVIGSAPRQTDAVLRRPSNPAEIRKLGKYFQYPGAPLEDTGTGVFGRPLDPRKMTKTSEIGWRMHKGKAQMHNGLDLAAPIGTPVYSIGPGTVVEVTVFNKSKGFGNVVVVEDDQGNTVYYGHVSKVCVVPGDRVERRDNIAAVGMAGNATGPHLDLRISRKVMIDGQEVKLYLDPEHLIDFPTGMVPEGTVAAVSRQSTSIRRNN